MKSWMSLIAPGLLLSAVACGGAAPVQPERPVAAPPVCPPCTQAAAAPVPAPAAASQCPQATVTQAAPLSLPNERWDTAVLASFLRVTPAGDYQVQYAVFNFSFTNPSENEFVGFVLPTSLPATAVSSGTPIPITSLDSLSYTTTEGIQVVTQRVSGPTPFSVVWVPPKKRFVLNNFMIPTTQPDAKQVALSIPVTSLENALVFSPSLGLNNRQLQASIYAMAKWTAGEVTIDAAIRGQHNIPISPRRPNAGETWFFSFNQLRKIDVSFTIAN